jgi:hypothetical protein
MWEKWSKERDGFCNLKRYFLLKNIFFASRVIFETILPLKIGEKLRKSTSQNMVTEISHFWKYFLKIEVKDFVDF